MDYIHVLEIMASVLFAAYLLWAVQQDVKEMKVARFTHLLGLGAVMVSILASAMSRHLESGNIEKIWTQNIWELAVVFLLQYIGYKLRCYGLADVFVIGLCSLFYYFQSAEYRCLYFYFLLYAIAGTILLFVQLCCGNLKGLKLKQKVPYIPYISIAFFLTKWVI